MTKQNVFGAMKYALLIATMFVVAVMFSACDLFGGGDSSANDAFDKAVKTTAEYTGSYTVRMTAKGNGMPFEEANGEGTGIITYNAETSEFASVMSSDSMESEFYIKKNGDAYKMYSYSKVGTTIDKNVQDLQASEVVGEYSIADGVSGVTVAEPTSEEINKMFAEVFGVTFESAATFNKSVKKDGKLNVATYEVSNEQGESETKVRCVASATYKSDTKLTAIEIKYERFDGTATEANMSYTQTETITYTYDSTIMPTDFSKFDDASWDVDSKLNFDDNTGEKGTIVTKKQNIEEIQDMLASAIEVTKSYKGSYTLIDNGYMLCENDVLSMGNVNKICTYDVETNQEMFSYEYGDAKIGKFTKKTDDGFLVYFYEKCGLLESKTYEKWEENEVEHIDFSSFTNLESAENLVRNYEYAIYETTYEKLSNGKYRITYKFDSVIIEGELGLSQGILRFEFNNKITKVEFKEKSITSANILGEQTELKVLTYSNMDYSYSSTKSLLPSNLDNYTFVDQTIDAPNDFALAKINHALKTSIPKSSTITLLKVNHDTGETKIDQSASSAELAALLMTFSNFGDYSDYSDYCKKTFGFSNTMATYWGALGNLYAIVNVFSSDGSGGTASFTYNMIGTKMFKLTVSVKYEQDGNTVFEDYIYEFTY